MGFIVKRGNYKALKIQTNTLLHGRSHLEIMVFILYFFTVGCSSATGDQKSLMIILDLSTSMDAALRSGQSRLEETKQSLCEFIDNDIPHDFYIGLRVFSNRTARIIKMSSHKENAEKMKNEIMSLSSIGGTNFESILAELPNDFAGLSGKKYILVAGDGQYDRAIYPSVIQCRKTLEQNGKVKGIGVGLDLTNPREIENLKMIAHHFTSPDTNSIYTHVNSTDFSNLSFAFYKIRYHLLILYRLIAFAICILITAVFSQIVYELGRTASLSPFQSAFCATLSIIFLIYISFIYYLSDVAGGWLNLLMAASFLTAITYFLVLNRNRFFNPHANKDEGFTL